MARQVRAVEPGHLVSNSARQQFYRELAAGASIISCLMLAFTNLQALDFCPMAYCSEQTAPGWKISTVPSLWAPVAAAGLARSNTNTILVLSGVFDFGPIAVQEPLTTAPYSMCAGTGKTLLARAVANRTDACFIRVIGSELVQKYVGEGARMVRERLFTVLHSDSLFIENLLSFILKNFHFYKTNYSKKFYYFTFRPNHSLLEVECCPVQTPRRAEAVAQSCCSELNHPVILYRPTTMFTTGDTPLQGTP